MPKTTDRPSIPIVKISARGAPRLKDGHVWVYRSDIVSADGVPAGSLVNVVDHRGQPLGSALYSSSSQIAIRLISREPVADFPALLRQRIAEAITYREGIVHDSNAYRVIFSEADFLPGLIVDRYNDILSMQILTQAMDAEMVRETLTSELTDRLCPASIVERVDPRVRQLEDLLPRASGLVQGEKASTIFTMNGVQFHFDALEGQKTGAFLDQRENYAAAAQYAHGDALDVSAIREASRFIWSGAARTSPASTVPGRRSRSPTRTPRSIAAKASRRSNGSKPTPSICSRTTPPPASATTPSSSTRRRSPRVSATSMPPSAATRLNLRALKMLRPGGVLVTCSCSYHVSQADFLEVLADASHDAHRTLRVVEVRGQAKDHPVLLNVPETAYLKCVVSIVS